MRKKLNIYAPYAKTGYGVAALNFTKNLPQFGIEPLVRLIGQTAHVNDAEEKALIEGAVESGKYPDGNSPCLKIWHQFDLALTIKSAHYFAMPIFELNKFNNIEKCHLNIPNTLLVNSRWAQEIIRDQVKRDSEVVPLGVDTKIFKPHPKSQNQDTYRFINIGKWEVRKGHDILVDLFNKAFTKDDNVELIMLPHNPFYTPQELQQWKAKYQNSQLGDKIFIFDPVNTHAGVAGIINDCDCGIYPSRAEGFNLELLETMACEKPVITTNYSAHTEYCTKDNAYLTEITELEEAYDGKWFHRQGQWAKLTQSNMDELIDYMRHCYKERPNNPDGVATAQKFSWLNSTQKLVEKIFKSE